MTRSDYLARMEEIRACYELLFEHGSYPTRLKEDLPALRQALQIAVTELEDMSTRRDDGGCEGHYGTKAADALELIYKIIGGVK